MLGTGMRHRNALRLSAIPRMYRLQFRAESTKHVQYRSNVSICCLLLFILVFIFHDSCLQFLQFMMVKHTANHIIDGSKHKIEDYRQSTKGEGNGCVISMHSGYKFGWKESNIFIQNKILYSTLHAYVHHMDKPAHLQRHPTYNDVRFWKPWILDFYLYQHRDIEYFLWIDGDAMFTNMTITLQQRFQKICFRFKGEKHGEINMIVGADHNGINNGVILIRNTPWTRNFVRLWCHWALDREESSWKWYDQSQLVDMLRGNAMSSEEHILLLDPARTHWLQLYLYQQNQWIVHHPNENGLELIINAVNDTNYIFIP